MDRISDLPEPIIHRIMFFLPTRDATLISSLSKSFRSLWLSYPIMDFCQTFFKKPPPPLPSSCWRQFHDPSCVSKSRVEETDKFLDYVHSSIRHRELRTELEMFRLHAKFYTAETFCGDDRFYGAINFAIEKRVKLLDVGMRLKDNNEVPWFWCLPETLFFSKSITFLRLEGAKVDVKDLISRCTSIESLHLDGCDCSPDIRIFSAKLKALELEHCHDLERIEIKCPNLQAFVFKGFMVFPTIDLTGCMSLKRLSLDKCDVTDKWVKNCASTFLQLEDLELRRCDMLESLEIHNERLKTFHLLDCTRLVQLKVDTPRLLSFRYWGDVISFGLMNSSLRLNASLSFNTMSPRQNSRFDWFVKLRVCLSYFDHCKTLKLACQSDKDLTFPEEIRENSLPPLSDLKLLKIRLYSMSSSFTKLVDSLLWISPHLDTLKIRCGSVKRSIKFKYGRRRATNEESNCCRALLVKCWRHSIQQVEMKNFENSGDLDDLLRYFNNSTKMENV